MDEPPFALVCGWRYPLLIIAKGGSFSTVSTLRLFSSTSIACGFLYEKNPTISNVKSLDLWSEWRESNSRPLEPHCASPENTMYNPILPRLSIVKFQMHYTILFHWMSRRFIPFVVKLWSNDPDK